MLLISWRGVCMLAVTKLIWPQRPMTRILTKRNPTAHPNGTPLIPDQITQDFASLVQRFGLPHLTFHGLRHAYATLVLREGIQPKVGSKAMGHSKVGITMDLYRHVLDDMQDDLADAISDVLIKAN